MSHRLSPFEVEFGLISIDAMAISSINPRLSLPEVDFNFIASIASTCYPTLQLDDCPPTPLLHLAYSDLSLLPLALPFSSCSGVSPQTAERRANPHP
jgi:hypothetical protein